MQLSKKTIHSFQKTVWQFYILNKRVFSWRKSISPYNIVVSEVMLQQTQTFRVAAKYEQFLMAFPTFKILAQATLKEVLAVWQGLGYNRRAQSLHNIAKRVVNDFDGELPSSPELLIEFPGIGVNTAGSICAFAYNCPTVFIETNIRTVFLYTFFKNRDAVDDKEILPLVEQALDTQCPREWYYALMDYGVMLKRCYNNPSRKSKHYSKQSPFIGSDRQVRSMIVKLLLKNEEMDFNQIASLINRDVDRVKKIVAQLSKEEIIKKSGALYKIV